MDFGNLTETQVGFIAVIVSILGLILCMVGYRLSRVSLGIIGFFIGSYIGAYVTTFISARYGISSILPQNIPWITLFAGIALAISFAIYKRAGLVGIGVASGTFIGVFFLPQFLVYAIVLGVLLGIAAVFLEQVVVVPITSFTGAVFFAMAIYLAVYNLQPLDVLLNPIPHVKVLMEDIYVTVLTIVLGLMGILTQAALIRTKEKEK
jgi:hypothetical protein